MIEASTSQPTPSLAAKQSERELASAASGANTHDTGVTGKSLAATTPRMDILLYGLNYEPELTGIGKYSGEMARWLANRGHGVQVVTAPPYYPEWRIREGHSGWRYSQDSTVSQAGLSVLRCPLWVPQKVSGKTRMLHLASFAMSSGPALLWMALRKRPSVIMLVVPTLACAPAAVLVGKILRIPLWLHVQDFEVDAMHAMGLASTNKLTIKLALAFESWLMKRFDRVSSISPNMVARLLSKGIRRESAVEFPNWVDVSTIRPQPPGKADNPVRKKVVLSEDAFVILYAGNMGQKQGIEVVIDAARLLIDKPRIQFVMVGAGASVEQLKQHAAGLPNVQWLPLQPIELLNDLLNMADAHVLPQRADAADLVMPSKLTGMLASGRPVIGTAALDTQLGEVLEQCGVRVAPGDAHALADAMEKLAADQSACVELGQKGRQYALDHLSHTAVLTTFEENLHKMVKVTS